MDIEKYIASGVLELYVAGTLSEEENREVHRNAEQYPEIMQEIEAIEASILALSSAAFTGKAPEYHTITNLLKSDDRVRNLSPKKSGSWISYMGWAASVALAIGMFWIYSENSQLKSDLEMSNQQNLNLEEQIATANDSKAQSETLLKTLREKDIQVVLLGGQDIAPTSYAKAYWNATTQEIYIDAEGLPEPPDGMVYQVWSLKLEPLTPTSLGLLSDFTSDTNKVFALTNPNASEAFGITLEPAGGSDVPSLDKLYTLGVVSS